MDKADAGGVASTPGDGGAVGPRTLTLEQGHTGWTSYRQFTEIDSIEIFVSPNGHRYKACASGETPDLLVPMRTPGLKPRALVCIDHWVSPADEEEDE